MECDMEYTLFPVPFIDGKFNKCPFCGENSEENMIGIEYPEIYDGVSEWFCKRCYTKWNRWTGKILGSKKGAA